VKTLKGLSMHKLIAAILLCSVSLLAAATYNVKSVKQLYDAVQSIDDGITIILETGDYDLTPMAVTDSTLGNAVNPDSMITVTAGLHIHDKTYIKLIGKDRRKTIIRTYAGYGIFIEHCYDVLIKDLTITDGTRDQDPNATSGAIVVKHSDTKITGCIIENNNGDYSKTVAGIIGICGREGSYLKVDNNIIRDNSWDGIALYRGAHARIWENLICNGRGAGIGITWDSVAEARFNVIHHYWKGIGSFGTSRAEITNNLVRDIRGWGIIASGNSQMNCFYNEVRRIGNVGIALWNDTSRLKIYGNVINQCGLEKQWVAPLVGIWINAPDSTQISYNLFWDNKQADIAYGYQEPGLDGSDFTFQSKTEKFNNYHYKTSESLNSPNYYTNKADISKMHLSSVALTPDPDTVKYPVGIRINDWTWDPDGEPFKD